jgi:hypothetical protein
MTTYRPRTVSIVVSIAFAMAFAVFALVGIGAAIVTAAQRRFDVSLWALLDAAFSGAAALGFWRQSRLRIHADEEGLTIVNYLSSRRIAWTDMDRFDSSTGYLGTRLLLRDGTIVLLNALQKANAASWLGWETRADRLTKELDASLARHAGGLRADEILRAKVKD